MVAQHRGLSLQLCLYDRMVHGHKVYATAAVEYPRSHNYIPSAALTEVVAVASLCLSEAYGVVGILDYHLKSTDHHANPCAFVLRRVVLACPYSYNLAELRSNMAGVRK